MPKRKLSPGERLRATRLALGLSLRDIRAASLKLARQLRNRRFILPPSRLCEYEKKNGIPSICRLYTLAQMYGCDLRELLDW